MRSSLLPIPEIQVANVPKAGFWGRRWFVSSLILIVDIVIWIAVFWGLIHLRGNPEKTSRMIWWISCAVGLIAEIGSLYVIGGYRGRTDMLTLTFAAEYLLAIMTAAGISVLIIYTSAAYTQNIKPSRAVILGVFLLAPCLGLVLRRTVSVWTRARSKTQEFLVIGSGEMARRFYQTYRKSKQIQELRFVSDGSSLEPIDGANSPTVLADPLQQVRNLGNRVIGIIVADEPKNISGALAAELIRVHFEKVPVYTLESFYDNFWQKVPVLDLDGVWPLQKGFALSADTPYNGIKRFLDVVLVSFGLILSSPILALVALIVRLDSRGPIIFRQERMGLHKRSFSILKFRTMQEREEEGSLYTTKKDSRITRSGKWLRKSRLDELPQLWNVFRGDMSLIGPRAEWVKLIALYQDVIPSYHFRHLVRPGITGWAQVNYPYGSNLEDAIQKLKYDLYYIRHYSLKLDAMIILKTIHVIFFARGT